NEAAAAAKKVAAEKAKAAAEEAARTFPTRQASLQESLAVIEGATKSKDWTTAQQRLQQLQLEVAPLFASTIGKTPDVVAIQERVQTQRAAVVDHVKKQQAADAEKQWAADKKKRMEIAARDEAAERARRAAWQP